MGQGEFRATVHRPTEEKHFSGPKTLTVSHLEWHCLVEICDDNLTCGWLLSEVIRKLKQHVVALRTRGGVDILDYWLTRMERSLEPLRDAEELELVFAGKRYAEDVPEEMGKEHFDPIKLIGRGGFSRVIEARKKDTGQLYAMKIMSKAFILQKGKVQQILTERKVMASSQHPFIIQLHWAFQSVRCTQKTELFLVMDFCPGGELFFHLKNLGRLTEEQAKFYIAEILLGLQYLHENDIIYRDLKPENVLLDLDGHICLTDFGLCKEHVTEDAVSLSFCGSPEYMSPEMLRGEGHCQTVDYYSLGAVLYEMLVGLPPFYDRNVVKMFKAIQHDVPHLPKYLSRASRDLIMGLLEKDPSVRLGAVGGFGEIKSHPWFAGVDWQKVIRKQVPPPFFPNLRLSNFDPEYTSEPVDYCQQGEMPKWPQGTPDPFSGFDYTRDSDTLETADEGIQLCRLPQTLSKSASELSNSEAKYWGQGSKNISQAMAVIEEDAKDVDVTMMKKFMPEKSPNPRTRPASQHQDMRPRGPESPHIKLAQLPTCIPSKRLEKEVSTTKFWDESSDEESFVREIAEYDLNCK